jgi:hypothetical protein
MAISIVNGFVCTSSCDVAKAKKGEDPHPLTGAAKIAAEKEKDAADLLKAGAPAVVFGGALARRGATETVQPIATSSTVDGLDRLRGGAAIDLLV